VYIVREQGRYLVYSFWRTVVLKNEPQKQTNRIKLIIITHQPSKRVYYVCMCVYSCYILNRLKLLIQWMCLKNFNPRITNRKNALRRTIYRNDLDNVSFIFLFCFLIRNKKMLNATEHNVYNQRIQHRSISDVYRNVEKLSNKSARISVKQYFFFFFTHVLQWFYG